MASEQGYLSAKVWKGGENIAEVIAREEVFQATFLNYKINERVFCK